ncbi:MAG: hypothetical protein H6712_13600 [Myxococcales bacterium]|nr:hypothetical protein [Myxococcales bacterium]MCB9714896.1 hypothetical protein [Myxococcales bacterium]
MYEADGLVILPVLVGRDPSNGVTLAESMDVTLPIAFDLEGELFRHTRLPARVFPLNVVIDRNGALVHVDGDLDTTKAEAAAIAALGA